MQAWIEMIKQNKVTFVIGGLIVILAIGGVIYGIATKAGDEGFHAAADGTVLKWDRSALPLTCFHDTFPNEEHQAALKEAIGKISKAGISAFMPCQPWMVSDPFPTKHVKNTVLIKVGAPPEPEREVVVTSPFEPKHGASTFLAHVKGKGIYGAIVYIMPDLDKKLYGRVYLHELLHALGLTHDRVRDSIMYPTAAERATDLSSKDTKLLLKTYGERNDEPS